MAKKNKKRGKSSRPAAARKPGKGIKPVPPANGDGKVSAVDIAAEVIAKAGPVRFRDLYPAVLGDKRCSLTGKFANETIRGAIYRDVARRGDDSRFTFSGGVVSLRSGAAAAGRVKAAKGTKQDAGGGPAGDVARKSKRPAKAKAKRPAKAKAPSKSKMTAAAA